MNEYPEHAIRVEADTIYQVEVRLAWQGRDINGRMHYRRARRPRDRRQIHQQYHRRHRYF